MTETALEQALDQAEAWRDVRLTRQGGSSLLADFADRGATTSWPVARLAQREARHQLAGWPTERMTGADLVISCTEYFALGACRDSFLPEVLRPSRAPERWAVLLHWIWLTAERHGAQPEALVSSAVARAALGRLALDEVPRRIARHIGVNAAIWVLLARWPYSGPAVGDDEIRQATLRVLGLATKHVRASLQREAEESGEVLSQVAATLLTRPEFAEVHPVDLLVRALDGGIDFAPKAIGNGTSLQMLKGLPTPPRASRPRTRKITVEFRPGDELPEPDNSAVDPEAAAIAAEERDRTRARLAEARIANRKVFDTLAAAGGEKTAAARDLGTSRVTLDAWLKKMAASARRDG